MHAILTTKYTKEITKNTKQNYVPSDLCAFFLVFFVV